MIKAIAGDFGADSWIVASWTVIGITLVTIAVCICTTVLVYEWTRRSR